VITVSGTWLRSHKEFEEDHSKSHAYSKIPTSDGVEVKFIRGDTAIVIGEWSIAGVKELDGTPRQHQKGKFTWVLEKRQEIWWVVAVQNTFVR
jgi:ketosteroid isomerase-like protein